MTLNGRLRPLARADAAAFPETAHDEEETEANSLPESLTGHPSLDAALQLGGRLELLLYGATNTFSGLADDTNLFMEGVSLGEVLLCAANSAVAAIRGLASHHTDADERAWAILGGPAAEAVAAEVRKTMAEGPDRVHRRMRALFSELRRVLGTLKAHAANVGADHCAAAAAAAEEEEEEGDDDEGGRDRGEGSSGSGRGAARAVATRLWATAESLSNDKLKISLPPLPSEQGRSDSSSLTELLSGAKVTFSKGQDPAAPPVEMPLVGIGTCWLTPEETYRSVLAALGAGVRHIDTAEAYRNEEAIGRAIKDSGVPRQEIFLATKISSGEAHGYQTALDLIHRQLRDLGTDYLDLCTCVARSVFAAFRMHAWMHDLFIYSFS